MWDGGRSGGDDPLCQHTEFRIRDRSNTGNIRKILLEAGLFYEFHAVLPAFLYRLAVEDRLKRSLEQAILLLVRYLIATL
jgi:hypothetical protein